MAPLDQIILFGDSITQGSNNPNGFSFASALQDAYVRKLDVINRGFSGYNTNHGLEVLPQWFPTPEQASVRILLIFFGANDCNRGPSTKQHVPLEQFRTNLVNIITHPMVKAHDPRIILVTPAPVDEVTCRATNAEWGNSDEPRRVTDTLTYRDMVLQVGRELGHPVVDLWSAMMKVCGWNIGRDDVNKMPGQEALGKDERLLKLLFDGLHFTGDGYKILFEEVTKCIKDKYPEQMPENLDNKVKMQWEKDLGW